jgi:outer membrane protein assembly factor BamB
MIVHLDGSDRQFITALNKNTGMVAWKTDRSGEMRSNPQMKKSYGTPVVVKINGKDQIVSPASDWVYSYDPATGKELWKLSYGVLGFSVVPRPVVGNGFIYMSTGFMKPELLAIKYEGVKEPRIEWRISKGSTNMPSPLLIGDEIYIVNDGGILLCANAHTGEEYYRERLGGKFSSSPIYADGKLYVGSREGIMFVVQPGKQFKILAQNTMEGAIMATPAAVDGALFVRTDKGLFRLGAKP